MTLEVGKFTYEINVIADRDRICTHLMNLSLGPWSLVWWEEVDRSKNQEKVALASFFLHSHEYLQIHNWYKGLNSFPSGVLFFDCLICFEEEQWYIS